MFYLKGLEVLPGRAGCSTCKGWMFYLQGLDVLPGMLDVQEESGEDLAQFHH